MVYLEIDSKYEIEFKKAKIEVISLNNRTFLLKETLEKNYTLISKITNLKKINFENIIFTSEMENLKAVN